MFGRRNTDQNLPQAAIIEDIEPFLVASQSHPNFAKASTGEHGPLVTEIITRLPNARLHDRTEAQISGVWLQMVRDLQSILLKGEPAEMETAAAH